MRSRFGFIVCLAAILGAMFLTDASRAQTLSRAFRLVVGTSLRYDGTSQYRIAQAGAEPFVVDLEWRLQLFVLEHDDDRAVCAIVASRRKARTTDAYRTASLCFAELRRKDGTLRLLSEPGANDTSFLEQLLPQVAIPGSEERTRSYAIDVTQFGLQQADTTVLVHAKRQRVAGAAASEWMRTTFSLEADDPVTVQSGDTGLTVETFQREFVIDEKAGRLVSTHSRTKVLVHDTEQTRTSSFLLFSGGFTSIDSADLRLLRELRDVTILMQTDPVRARSLLRGLAKHDGAKHDGAREDEAKDALVALVTKDAERAAERARADEQWRSKVAALIGKEAPDFTLTSLDENDVHVRDLKGRLVLLAFWGVG